VKDKSGVMLMIRNNKLFSKSPLIANSEAAFDDMIDRFLICVLLEFYQFMLKKVVAELFNLYTLQEIYSISICAEKISVDAAYHNALSWKSSKLCQSL
jgi:hypothetical protein